MWFQFYFLVSVRLEGIISIAVGFHSLIHQIELSTTWGCLEDLMGEWKRKPMMLVKVLLLYWGPASHPTSSILSLRGDTIVLVSPPHSVTIYKHCRTYLHQSAFVPIKESMAEAPLEIQSRLPPDTGILFCTLHP